MAARDRDEAFANELNGLHVDIPWAGWGNQYASSSEIIRGMIVDFKRGHFHVRFPLPEDPVTEPTEELSGKDGLTWPQLFGETLWNGVRVLLQPLAWAADVLTLEYIMCEW